MYQEKQIGNRILYWWDFPTYTFGPFCKEVK